MKKRAWVAVASALAVCLVVFVYPILRGAKGSEPLGSDCLSHLKQLVVAMRTYGEDFDGRLPPGGRWTDATYPYVRRRNLYDCNVLPVPTAGHAFGYAMNASFSGLELAKIPEHDQANRAVVFESMILAPYISGTRGLVPVPGRHNDKSCFGFLDGHAGVAP